MFSRKASSPTTISVRRYGRRANERREWIISWMLYPSHALNRARVAVLVTLAGMQSRRISIASIIWDTASKLLLVDGRRTKWVISIHNSLCLI